MPEASVSLDDKYRLQSGRIFITGTQALVRLPMMQRHRDQAAGLNTACFISGYRGSPLGAYDQQLWRARSFLKENHIHFQPGVNEDLAATMIWGTQQSSIFGDCKYDGIYSIWYGKGPGVDRCGDVFRHGSLSGSSKHGGVLLLAGDDHAAKSSTTAHQCEYAFMDAMIPVLHPAGVQEILDFGLYGWAMSRYSGCWTGFKVIGETADSTASVYIDPHRVEIKLPEDFELPPDGVNIRWAGALDMVQQEERHHYYKLYAALAFARANKLDKTVIDGPKRRFGIVTTGKSYLDVRQALDDLGIDEEMAADIGLSLYKVGMVWPLEREGMRHFAEGLEEIIVVEEKRAVIENQLKEQLYNWRDDVRPRVVGKFDEAGKRLMYSNGELSPARIAQAIAARLKRFYTNPRIEQRLAMLEQEEKALLRAKAPVTRIPTFCSGCPHNTSTKVPEGSRALAGIGCHYMVQWMDRETATFTQMGGEGCTWLGQAPFSTTKHVFVNLGDGTYYHSGLMAIRQAVASGANITYKILYNDAVAMTGGQPVDGPLSPDMIARQVAAEGVKQVVIVSDEPDKYPIGTEWPSGATIHHRDELDQLQRDLREVEGTTVLIYDQTCAAEKRRRRKRGLFPDPPKRVFINEDVCEGCGDCSVQSNCVSVVPQKTEFGTKRKIDQSSCNKDFSCLKGFCPSFVTVHHGEIRKEKLDKAADGATAWEAPPEPQIPGLDDPHNIVITGVGGTGVVTIGAILGMAAHIEGKGCSILDMAGLAQKGGAVVSHVRIGEKPEDIHAVRVSAGRADLVIGCDMVVTAGQETLSKIEADLSKVVVNAQETITQEFTRDPNYKFPAGELKKVISEVARDPVFVDASRIATALLGDSIATNLFMLGYAYQLGVVPVGAAAIEEAIEINGVAVNFNKQALLWGRRAAHDLAAVEKLVGPAEEEEAQRPHTLDEIIERRVRVLTDYQDARYAARYKTLMERVRAAEQAAKADSERFSEAVARNAFKLMAYKDEYEVARLYTSGDFERRLKKQFDGDFKLSFHLAPPLLANRDPATGHLKKREYGPWIFTAFKLLKKLKGLRGTKLDLFGYSAERRQERQLIEDYVALIEELSTKLTPENLLVAVDLAALPDMMRGFGHVKERNIRKAKQAEAELMARFRDPAPTTPAAEAAE